jgi:hypothetical protein
VAKWVRKASIFFSRGQALAWECLQEPAVAHDLLGIGLLGLNGQVTAVTNLSEGTDYISNLHRAIYRRMVGDPGEVGVLRG